MEAANGAEACGDGHFTDAHQDPAINDDHSGMLCDLTSSAGHISAQDAKDDENAMPTSPVKDTVPVLMKESRSVTVLHLEYCKNSRTTMTNHFFDTNNPLLDSTWKRQHVPGAQNNDLWTLWRHLDDDRQSHT